MAGFLIVGGGSESYTVRARYLNAGQLVAGNPVQIGGVDIGSVKRVSLASNGEAEIELEIDKERAPLRAGTRAVVRQLSQSGLANRYVELRIPSGGGEPIADGGMIESEKTRTAVDLDQVFATLDPRTRRALQGVIKGQARLFEGRGREAAQGIVYLNPALATSARLFRELDRDTPVLRRFLVDSARLAGTLDARRSHLAGLIGHLNQTTTALGREKEALAGSIERLPPFMRGARTTFVNLRAALDDVDPLVEAAQPVADQLGPVLADARRLAVEGRPAVRELSVTIERAGAGNDLVELLDSIPKLAEIALVAKPRSVSPGGHRVDVGEVRGAFPETAEALTAAAPEIAFARPYTSDFLGWLDDFSTTGAAYDALGGISRGQISFVENIPGATSAGHFHRCPGGAEPPAADGSNVFSAAERERLRCAP